MSTRRCPICRTDFPVTSHLRLYCSSKCRRKKNNMSERKRETLERVTRMNSRLEKELCTSFEDRTYNPEPTNQPLTEADPAAALDLSDLAPEPDVYARLGYK